jgi:HAE1 family hydrophobic/amphiphilic exporter-1
MSITELAIKRPSLIIVLFIAITLLGIFGYSQLKYELLPNINIPVISVMTSYPGASAGEVETSVTKPVEDAVSALDKVSTVHATSQEGVSIVTVEFQQDANLDFAMQDAQRKLNEIAADLPETAKAPSLSKLSLNEQPVLRMGATSTMGTREFSHFLKETVQPKLAQVAGVGQVTLVGTAEREIRINVDPQKLRGYGLSLLQVAQAVQAANLDFPTGKVKDRDAQFVVRLAGKFASLAELRALIVGRSPAGGDIRLGDIAEVQDGAEEMTNFTRINGRSAVVILVQKQSDANAVEVCKQVRRAAARLEREFAASRLRFDVAQDSSIYTIDAANAVKEDLGIAILLVALVMLLFLHSLRNSLIVMVAIPASLVATMIGMWALGYSLNLMTLLALSLVIGILVDDSIVVLENIYRHLESGAGKRRAALEGRNEIGFTALSITMVDVVVFVPLAMVSGVIGGIMREFSLVVVFSTLMSLFVSFTVTPMLASRFSKLEQLDAGSLLGRFGTWFEGQYRRLTQSYLRLLQWSLGHRWQVVLGALLCFVAAGSLLFFRFIGAEFLPQTDRGEFAITLELPPGVKLVQTNAVAHRVEAMLARYPEVRKLIVNVGASSSGFIGMSSDNIAEIQVVLRPKEERRRSTDAVGRAIRREVLLGVAGVKCQVNPVAIWGMAGWSPIELAISGSSWEETYRAAKQVERVMKRIPGTADIRLSAEEGNPETRVEVDREKLAALGLTIADVGSVLQIGLTGNDDSKYRDSDGTEYPVRVMLDAGDRSAIADLGELAVMNRFGRPVPVKQFARVYQALGPTKLQRIDRSYGITVSSQAVGRPSGTIAEDIQKALAREQLPPGIELSFMGDVEQQQDSFASLGLALVAAIIFVYLIMVALYDSFIYPLVVLFAVPLAVIGALLALALTMNSLNIFTILGLIMQIGLVSKNAILLVDFANKARAEGRTAPQALLEAGRERLRPILMTTLTMIFGMLPIALSDAAGAEFKQGLGWALIGGLSVSMGMTLVLVPVIYLMVDTYSAKLKRVFRRGRAAAAEGG